MDRICMSVAILPMAKEFGWPASVQVSLTTLKKPSAAALSSDLAAATQQQTH